MTDQTKISFDNTEYAFAAKSDKELKQANFLFGIMGKAWLVNLGLKITPIAIKWGIPFTKTLIRQTIFRQFVGGETLEETAKVADKLEEYKVQVILDYGVEGKEGESNFEHARDEFKRVIDYAATQANIPFMSIKVTGFARFSLLEKLDAVMHNSSGTLMKRYLQAVESLTDTEKEEWHKVRLRTQQLCEVADKKNIGTVLRISGTTVDVQFESKCNPQILHLLLIICPDEKTQPAILQSDRHRLVSLYQYSLSCRGHFFDSARLNSGYLIHLNFVGTGTR